jgi:polar amino acid transport system substrate-binding protein
MKSFRLIAAVAALIACFSSVAMAAGPAKPMRTVTVATDATWPPMEMVDAKKQIVGFDIDYMNAVAREAGFKAVFKNTAWDGIFAGVEAGQYDAIISSVTITPERKAKYDFSLPYVNAGQILVVPKTERGTRVADLKGKKVGAQIGTTGAMEIKKNAGVQLKTYDEVGLAFEDMAAGRIAGVVCDEPTAIIYALQKKEYSTKFKIVGKPFTREAYGIVVKKGNKELLALIDKGVAAVKKKKIDETLRKKWLK